MVLLVVVPVIGPIVLMGYECEIHQRLARAHPRPVPKFSFDDFAIYLGRGLAPFLASLVYSLPMIVATGALMIGWILVRLSSETRGLGDPQAFEGLVSSAPAWPPTPSASDLLFMLLVAAAWLVLLLPPIASRLLAERTEDLTAALTPRNVWQVLRGSGGRILWSYFVFALYSLPLLLGGLLLFCIGCYVVMAGLHLASAHLRWQIASAHEAGGGTLAPAKPETPLPSGN